MSEASLVRSNRSWMVDPPASKAVRRMPHGIDRPARSEVRVAHRHRDGAVAHPLLDLPQRHAGADELRSERASRVRTGGPLRGLGTPPLLAVFDLPKMIAAIFYRATRRAGFTSSCDSTAIAGADSPLACGPKHSFSCS